MKNPNGWNKVRVAIVGALVINAFAVGVGWGVMSQRVSSLEARFERQDHRQTASQEAMRKEINRSFDRLERRLEQWYLTTRARAE